MQKSGRRATENTIRDMTNHPVDLLYDETNDLTVMRRGNSDGAASTIGSSKICTNNSTAAQLNADAKFTGVAGITNGYATILLSIYSDQDSATDGLKLFFSHDDSPYDWHEADAYTYTATSYKTYSFQPVDAYFKVEYTNGSGGTTTNFHISTRLHSSNVKASSHRMADDIKGQDDAELVKAILAAERPGTAGVYTNIQATNGGNLKVSVEEFDSLAVLPEVSNVTSVDTVDVVTLVTENRNYLENEINNTWYKQEMDGSSGAMTEIIEEHHKVHVGMHFNVHGVQDLANGNVLDLQWTLNDWDVTTEEIHWLWNISTESETLWTIYEDAAIVNAGTAVTPINNQRNSANTSVTTMALQLNTSLANANVDTNVSGATILATGIAGSGKDAGEAGRGAEMVMKEGSIYCLRAVATVAGFVNFVMEWYEHAPHVANNWINAPLGTV